MVWGTSSSVYRLRTNRAVATSRSVVTCRLGSSTRSRVQAGVVEAEADGRLGQLPGGEGHRHLAVLAAAHAKDGGPLEYRIRVSDPSGGLRVLELDSSSGAHLHWEERDGLLTLPEGAAGLPLMALRDWIVTLPEEGREPARILQWASLVAHGRTMPIEEQSDATALPPSCFTFQPEQAALAERVGERLDFSAGGREPLADLAPRVLPRL